MRRYIFVFMILWVPLFFLACATSIPVTVTKPAEINMAANRVIAVLEFRYPDTSRRLSGKDLIEWAISRLTGIDIPQDETTAQKVAEYTTSRVVMTLLDTGYFQLVGPEEVARTMQGGITSSTTAVDVGRAVKAQAIINGELYLLDSEDEEWTAERTIVDEDGTEQTVEVPMVKRTFRAGMSYQVVNTSSGTIVASRSFKGQSSAEIEKENQEDLPDAEIVYKRIIDSFMPRMARQLAPYQVRESRTLMRDKSKDPRMEQADDLVKGMLYDEALEIFLDVWSDNRNVAAGFNAAIIYEITGQIEAAIAQMKSVAESTADKRAMREYRRLLEVEQEQERLREQQ